MVQGLGIRGTARVFEVDPKHGAAVAGGGGRAAAGLRAASCTIYASTRRNSDELFALLSAVKNGEVNEAEAITRLERSPQWVWVALDPESKLLLAIDVGESYARDGPTLTLLATDREANAAKGETRGFVGCGFVTKSFHPPEMHGDSN